MIEWQNHDLDVRIDRPLPWPDNSAEFIILSHCLEHVPSPDGYRFMQEAYRVLKPGGVLRLAVPSILRVYDHADDEYLAWLKDKGFGDSTKKAAIENIVLNHGHMALWSKELLFVCLSAVGFKQIIDHDSGQSTHPELVDVDRHDRAIGKHADWVETIAIEGTKL